MDIFTYRSLLEPGEFGRLRDVLVDRGYHIGLFSPAAILDPDGRWVGEIINESEDVHLNTDDAAIMKVLRSLRQPED